MKQAQKLQRQHKKETWEKEKEEETEEMEQERKEAKKNERENKHAYYDRSSLGILIHSPCNHS